MEGLKEIISKFPEELRDCVLSFYDFIKEDIGIKRVELEEIKLAIKNLTEKVSELAEAQRKTEERVGKVENRLDRVEIIIQELAEAQRKTEERVNELAEAQRKTEERVNELAEAQKRTEERLNELTEAQRKTEERVNELVEAQKRTEERLNELAEAQRKTEEEIRKLTTGLIETKEMIAGLSDTVGYGLEDRAIKYLPEVLKNRFNITLKSSLVRKYLTYNGEEIELNIYGEGEKEGVRLDIIGEAKSRPSKKDINKFVKKINLLEKRKVISENKFLLLVCYTIRPEVERYAKEKNVEVIWSYEIQ